MPNFIPRRNLALPDFPGFFKFGFKVASKIEGRAKVISRS